MPLIPALRRQKQVYPCDSEANLVYIVSSMPVRTSEMLSLFFPQWKVGEWLQTKVEEVVFKILGSSDNSINQKITVFPKMFSGGKENNSWMSLKQ